jgi:hypothetical protein
MIMTTKFRITVEVEFSDKGLKDYRDAVDLNYGDPTTKQDIRESLKGYALQGIDAHFSVMEVDPIEGDHLARSTYHPSD